MCIMRSSITISHYRSFAAFARWLRKTIARAGADEGEREREGDVLCGSNFSHFGLYIYAHKWRFPGAQTSKNVVEYSAILFLAWCALVLVYIDYKANLIMRGGV